MKNGWIIYNGSLETKKIISLVEELAERSKNFHLTLLPVKNNELSVQFLEDGSYEIRHIMEFPLPDYVIFWDKDIFLAKALEGKGIRLFNSSKAIESCDNKAKTFQILAENGIRLPKTILAPFVYQEQKLSEEYYAMLERELSYPMILKEHYGSFGMQVYLVENEESLKNRIQTLSNKGFFFEKYVKESKGRDIRVVIVGNEIVGAMLRTNQDDFRANITIGGAGKEISLTKEQEDMALRAHKILGLDFSGVDLLFGKNEKPILCEVNSNVNYLSYENVSGKSVSDAILFYVKKEMEK